MANWEQVQIKTFTKWVNNHLNREWGPGVQLEDILKDWENGIILMKLAVALYKENEKNPEQAVSMPKLRKSEREAKMRIAMVSNCNKALALLKQAGCKVGVSAENMVDHDKIQLLGMVWMIILDYAARGFGGTSAEVKKALLEWVNKKTDGYERVNPPGVKNFHKDWRSGLAWCALIDRHRPGLIDYKKCLESSNAENLETAFSTAEGLGIPRLLDVEDVDVEKPDEKSCLTYVMEYFLAFAGDNQREQAAKQAADWLRFIRELRNRMNDYERRARLLKDWSESTIAGWQGYDFGDTKDQALAAFDELRNFVGTVKPPQEMEKMDIESLYAEIQTTLLVNGLSPYKPPEDITPEKVGEAFRNVNSAQDAHGNNVRAAKFKFIEKKEDTSEADTIASIEKTFSNYDVNNNGVLTKNEFLAGCMEMGVALRDQESKDKLFEDLAHGGESVTKEAFTQWMLKRNTLKLDSPDSVKEAFKAIAMGNGNGISADQLQTQPLTDEDREFLLAEMNQSDGGLYDYNAFVDKMMGAS